MELRSELQAGVITREQFRDAMEEEREAMRPAGEELREQLAEILSEEQMEELETSRRRGFGRRGAAFGPRGRAWRGRQMSQPRRGFWSWRRW
jgi:hypothetical protein